jgi:hypothetical protein
LVKSAAQDHKRNNPVGTEGGIGNSDFEHAFDPQWRRLMRNCDKYAKAYLDVFEIDTAKGGGRVERGAAGKQG